MAKSARRQKTAVDKTARKAAMMQASGTSNYAKKAKYLIKNGGIGSDYPEPKPWKSQ